MKKKNLFFPAVLFLFLTTAILSCLDEINFHEIDCSECYRTRPENGELIIHVTINEENPEVPITIFRDRIEAGRVRLRDTAYEKTVYVEVPLNHYYSVKADYKVGNDSVFSVDGDEFKTYRITDQCDTICWIIKGGKFNLRLKDMAP